MKSELLVILNKQFLYRTSDIQTYPWSAMIACLLCWLSCTMYDIAVIASCMQRSLLECRSAVRCLTPPISTNLSYKTNRNIYRSAVFISSVNTHYWLKLVCLERSIGLQILIQQVKNPNSANFWSDPSNLWRLTAYCNFCLTCAGDFQPKHHLSLYKKNEF